MTEINVLCFRHCVYVHVFQYFLLLHL